jgi:hypothetical protein
MNTMKNLEDLRRHLQAAFDQIECHCRYDDFYTAEVALALASEAQRLACRFGCDVPMTTAATPMEALQLVGRLLAWAETLADRPFVPPEVMTAEDTIRYLRLGVDNRDPAERLRNLVRRQGLPVVRRGRLLVFRKTAIDQWLDVRSRSNYAGNRPGVCPANLNRKERA